MPCDEERVVKLDFRNADESLLQQTLEELGITGRYSRENGLLTLRNYSLESQKAIQREYSKKLIYKAAKEKKWKVEEKDGKVILRR